ncbi:single-stranded DNA-binding protein [Lactiplantibacillus plantarum]|uniref:single-stranded DNA-binding protein n=1 Tax=Lactiplantibacillus plantarum TaxID=1590 RepID=UPI0021A42371|nr:single-stranded DNA-binding protein [Lactiplantibacillus plantarum]MCT3214502.1 single-stranded DNA-binding protein [Lactiplantibacillus plantarum]MCT3270713.1 single-stranded DNA-binding protein [Lactiplantibacillus plantarum]
MINRTVLVGHLTRDPELRYTNGGAAVATFTIAVNRPFTNQNGEREADFISCVIWRKAAENFANFTSKGSLVGLDGRIQTRNYENQQGVRVYVTELVVENFSLLESKAEADKRKEESNRYSSHPQSQTNADSQSASQAGDTVSAANDPFANNGNQVDISDDDLPF